MSRVMDLPKKRSARGYARPVERPAKPKIPGVHQAILRKIGVGYVDYPVDGVLRLIDQQVSIVPPTIDAQVRGAFCAQLAASAQVSSGVRAPGPQIRCTAEAQETGPGIALTLNGQALTVRGAL